MVPIGAPVKQSLTDILLYGSDATAGIVAVEPVGADRMALIRRCAVGERELVEDAFRPWLVADRAEPWAAHRSRPEIHRLDGDHRLRYLVRFSNWPAYVDAERAGRDAGETYFRFRSRVEQYLVATGRTLFKGLVFDDLRRLQLDIETLGLDPREPSAQVITAAVRLAHQGRVVEEHLVLESTEADLLLRISDAIHRLDPDVIEGHNIFNFDLPFLAKRVTRLGVPLRWGRDGSPLRIGEGKQRFKVGALVLPFTPAYVFGRHIIDTYQQIQRYDISGRLGSYALKRVMHELYPDQTRTLIPGEQIRHIWVQRDLDRLRAYNLDDVRDVDTLSRLTVPTEFYQTQLLPRSFQSVATGGPGEKINDLMVRAYLSQDHSLPTAKAPRSYPGGHAELLEVGAFAPVVKCDVESLYPSIMLADRISSASDVLGASLPMLENLTRRRLDAKARSRAASGAERAVWDGLQSSFKVLINSFYGYLGYGGALFNDYDAAERVTLAGQSIIKTVVDELRRSGATPIEVDTDGVYFVPPPHVRSRSDEDAYIQCLGASLPSSIRLTHDGRFAGMLSLRLKNYALLEENGTMLLKGSSLRSRKMEPCFRRFLSHAARAFLTQQQDMVRDDYFALADQIRRRTLPVTEFSQWSMLNEETLAKQPRIKRLVERSGLRMQWGERVEIYEREDGELALVHEYRNDESVTYLLRRLRDVAERFRSLFPNDAAFDAFFPPFTSRTDMDAAREQQAAHQLQFFD